jgi:hypothetical protein
MNNSEIVVRTAAEKVIRGQGTPIYLVPRRNGGILLSQGTSHVLLSRQEIDPLVEAMKTMTEQEQ